MINLQCMKSSEKLEIDDDDDDRSIDRQIDRYIDRQEDKVMSL